MMVCFTDVNYASLDDGEQDRLLRNYSTLLNSFDPGIHAQFFFFNRKIPNGRIRERFDISPQHDEFDDIREEMSGLLHDLSANANEGVMKERYIILGTRAEGLSQATDILNDAVDGLKDNLSDLGSEVWVLDGQDRLELLFEYFNQDSEEEFPYSYDQIAQFRNSTKDYIAPDYFEFRNPRRYRMGNILCETKYVDITCSSLRDDFVRDLLAINDNISFSLHINNYDSAEALKIIKTALTNVQTSKIDVQKKAVRDGYDMDILPSDVVTFEKDFMKLRDKLDSSDQKLVRTTMLITVFAKNKRHMISLEKKIGRCIKKANCQLRDLLYVQEAAMNAAAPIGLNEITRYRNLITDNVAIMEPFNTMELWQDGQALYYGKNILSGYMILADRKNLRTPNGLFFGSPGSGKSFAAKREILQTFLMTLDDIIICDPEGEYYPLVSALGGAVIRLSTASTDYLNPMEIQLSHKNDREALKLKADFIITFCDHIAGGKYGLGNDEKGIIDTCLQNIYYKFFEDPVPEKMPILEDLYNALINYEPETAVTEELAIDARKKAVRIANSLVLYVHGSQNYFNHRSTVDVANRIICFDIRDLGDQLKELGMLIVQDAVWNRVSANRERKISTRYYCDEFHLLLRDKQTAQYSVEIWKRFRKWGGIPTDITQNVKDFLKNPDIEGILGNSDFVYLLNQSPDDREILGEKFNLSGQQLEYVTGSGRGCGLIRYDNVVIPFVDDYPEDTKTYALMNTRPQEEEN
jgi:type IV secretory pathway VirB4 component